MLSMAIEPCTSHTWTTLAIESCDRSSSTVLSIHLCDRSCSAEARCAGSNAKHWSRKSLKPSLQSETSSRPRLGPRPDMETRSICYARECASAHCSQREAVAPSASWYLVGALPRRRPAVGHLNQANRHAPNINLSKE